MIFYCNVSGTAQVVAKELAQYFKVDYINIDSTFKMSEELLILLVPVLGDEELNNNWLSFLQKSKSIFNEKNIIVFSFGSYDEFVDFDSVFVKQINFILGFSCNDINFYPLKISLFPVYILILDNYFDFVNLLFFYFGVILIN